MTDKNYLIQIRPMSWTEFNKYVEEIDDKIPDILDPKKPTKAERLAIGNWKRKAANWVLTNMYPDKVDVGLTVTEVFMIYELTMNANKKYRQAEIKNCELSSSGSTEMAQLTAEPVQRKTLEQVKS